VQRILRHSDPKITTEVFGHLAPEFLRAEVDRLDLGLAEAMPVEVPATAVAGSVPVRFVTPVLQEHAPGKTEAGTPPQIGNDSGLFTGGVYGTRTRGLRRDSW